MRQTTMLAAAAGALLLAGCASDGDAGAGDGMEPSDGAMEATATADAMTDHESSDEAMAEDSAGSDDAGDESMAAEPDPDNAFAFTGATLDGGEFDGLSIDDTDVILWFWAPWCPTCYAEAGEFIEALPQMPEGVEVVGVAGMSDDLDYMQEFVDNSGVTGMTHIVDLDGEIWKRFDVAAQATVLVIDDSGDAYTLGGGATATDLVEYAEKIAAT
ncbi:redoxin domain-containing protein [Demequina mangrovi]|uniref:Thiol-disulfide isomerase or thioredoxin n=1 Tax=Demequina mangrovi TaxID=1043493 RepID=A0A1H7A3C8_9MICO|nr:redoxin domain-containing protein [Demequina mangrovi]SEJ58407.1 Thiol-disulfide isomerase or thioredoxin [Demequina mangrovi]